MPAQSQQQQKLFGLALAVKRGEVPASEVSDEVKAIVDRMSEKDIEDFAGTKHDGLPKKVEAQIREMVREIMRERVIAEVEQSIDEAYSGNISDFKYDMENAIDNLGLSIKAIKKISKKGKRYEVRMSSYMSQRDTWEKIGNAIGAKLVDFTKGSINVGLYESVTEDGKMQGGEDDPCWKGYEMVGMKMKDGKEVPNCVPKNESVDEALSVDPRKVYGGTGAKEGMVLTSQKGLMKILDLSKKNPSNVFLVSDDNYTNFGPFYVKNGKVAKYTVANPNYDLEKNKVRTLKVPNDVILKFKIVESVNEVASRTAMEIGGLTGMNKDAIQKFVDTNELDIEKVFQFVKKGKLSDRMDLVSAIAGKPGNPIQKKMIKMFK